MDILSLVVGAVIGAVVVVSSQKAYAWVVKEKAVVVAEVKTKV